jgi:hypothetical protein
VNVSLVKLLEPYDVVGWKVQVDKGEGER